MSVSKSKASARPGQSDGSAAVDDFMARLEHPFKPEIEVIRELFMGVDEGITEGIKWNAPSFRTAEWFATTNLRAKGAIGIIFHLGAKKRELPAGGVGIEDSAGLLKWLGDDRAMVEFRSLGEIEVSSAALQEIVRQWVRYV